MSAQLAMGIKYGSAYNHEYTSPYQAKYMAKARECLSQVHVYGLGLFYDKQLTKLFPLILQSKKKIVA